MVWVGFCVAIIQFVLQTHVDPFKAAMDSQACRSPSRWYFFPQISRKGCVVRFPWTSVTS